MTAQYPPQAPYLPPPQPPRKRHPVRRWLLIASAVFAGGIAVLIALVFALGAAFDGTGKHASKVPATSPAAPAAPVPAAVPPPTGPNQLLAGETEQVSDDSGDVANITIVSAAASRAAVDQYSDPPANGYFVKIKVHATMTSGSFDLSSSDFYAVVRGQHYDEGNGNAYEFSGSRELMSTTLNAGESTTAWLYFDLPSPHGRIMYAPNYGSGPIAAWKF